MSKSAKIAYSVIAFLILAIPISASADFQTFSWEKINFLTASNSNLSANTYKSFYDKLSSAITNLSSLLNFQKTDSEENKETVKIKRKIVVTAYSSTPGQTDKSPFITAAGSFVREGVVAANFLKFGTKVRFPEVYGDKIFVVEDRMAKRNNNKIDIWMENHSQALEFGVKKLNIEILN